MCYNIHMYLIQEYVKWRGDLGFNIVPMTTEDIVVLCSLTYSPYEELAGEDYSGKTLAELNNRVFRDRHPVNDWGWQKALFALWMELPGYRRFAGIRLMNFTSVMDEEVDQQFAVATYEIDDTAVIAFRGTDTSITGWKENIEMAYKGVLSSQRTALEYVNKVLAEYEKVIICGHSKGGNLAMYSSAYCDEPEKISAIYNLDGPGLDRATYDAKWKDISAKTTTIVPQGTLFGVILGYGANYKVVTSNAKGFLQHDTFTWEFDGPRLNEVGSISRKSRKLGLAVHTFLEESSAEERRILIDAVYKLFEATGAKDMDEMISGLLGKAPVLIRELRKLDKDEKKVLRRLLKRIAFTRV